VKDIETELRKTLELYDTEYSVVEDEEQPVSLAELDLNEELGLNDSQADSEDGPEFAS